METRRLRRLRLFVLNHPSVIRSAAHLCFANHPPPRECVLEGSVLRLRVRSWAPGLYIKVKHPYLLLENAD